MAILKIFAFDVFLTLYEYELTNSKLKSQNSVFRSSFHQFSNITSRMYSSLFISLISAAPKMNERQWVPRQWPENPIISVDLIQRNYHKLPPISRVWSFPARNIVLIHFISQIRQIHIETSVNTNINVHRYEYSTSLAENKVHEHGKNVCDTYENSRFGWVSKMLGIFLSLSSFLLLSLSVSLFLSTSSSEIPFRWRRAKKNRNEFSHILAVRKKKRWSESVMMRCFG